MSSNIQMTQHMNIEHIIWSESYQPILLPSRTPTNGFVLCLCCVSGIDLTKLISSFPLRPQLMGLCFKQPMRLASLQQCAAVRPRTCFGTVVCSLLQLLHLAVVIYLQKIWRATQVKSIGFLQADVKVKSQELCGCISTAAPPLSEKKKLFWVKLKSQKGITRMCAVK